MKRLKSMISVLLIIAIFSTFTVGCRRDPADQGGQPAPGGQTGDQGGQQGGQDIRVFSAFFAVPGTEIPADNRLMNAIAEVTGARANMTWLTGQTASERIGVMVAGGEYPDFIDGSAGTPLLIDAGAFIPINEYWDNYPNIRNYLSDADWNKVRKEDGNIYIIPQFGILQGQDTSTTHNDQAFWLQKDVLEWAEYPNLKTLDEYFDVVSRYVEANQTIQGQTAIGFSFPTDDWRYFGMENPPMFLAGYPNDGACIVDPETLTAYNYNTIEEAYRYFKKLNEVYNNGLIDAATFTDSYDQYISKLSTGRVVGIVDQNWNFASAENSLRSQGLDERTYIPLPITLDRDTVDRYYNPPLLDVSNGVGISITCPDPERALQFLNDLLSPEVMILRFWGQEGVDYQVGNDGLFYLNEEQRAQRNNQDWVNRNLCTYAYLPHFTGTLADGINAINPGDQPGEFFATLTEIDQRILNAYGFDNFLGFLTRTERNPDWFPMWSYTNTWTSETEHGIARVRMDSIKREWLPRVIMSPANQFESNWEQYQNRLRTEVDLDAYEDALTDEVRRRVAVAQGQ